MYRLDSDVMKSLLMVVADIMESVRKSRFGTRINNNNDTYPLGTKPKLRDDVIMFMIIITCVLLVYTNDSILLSIV